MTRESGDRAELGDFLRARRAELTPLGVGLPDTGGQRRVVGLRREEVAEVAAISVDYYTRLEQGRVQASAAVLATLARALELNDDQRAYMYELAGKPAVRTPRRTDQQIRPAMRRLLDQLTETPAIVLGRRMDILAWNSMASALYVDFDALSPSRRNYLRLLFTDTDFRSLHAAWESAARTAVATLRMEAAHHPPTIQTSPISSGICLSKTMTSGVGGHLTTSPSRASEPSTTNTRSSASLRWTATPGTARTGATSGSWF
jgi:transcriptional regulator with XRE-family HTH domain